MDFLVCYDRPNIYYGLRGFETGAKIGGASDTAKGASLEARDRGAIVGFGGRQQ